jgi:adenosyl cobinamide kinase/adenosyl cobinamide phosphate guanylyltransferase
MRERIIVFEGLEMMIRRMLHDDLSACRMNWNQFFQVWHDWEKKDRKRRVVWIGCDITQGIVPMSQEERKWRDLTGWCYQDLVKLCDRVDRVWCGLVERMK